MDNKTTLQKDIEAILEQFEMARKNLEEQKETAISLIIQSNLHSGLLKSQIDMLIDHARLQNYTKVIYK